jgi:quinolinate synthase
MADAAVKMAAAGCTTVAVLGVDFMSENVRAILDEAGYGHVQVGAADNHSRLGWKPVVDRL